MKKSTKRTVIVIFMIFIVFAFAASILISMLGNNVRSAFTSLESASSPPTMGRPPRPQAKGKDHVVDFDFSKYLSGGLSPKSLSVSVGRSTLGDKGIPALASFSEDEIWVIARSETQVAPDEDAPTCGTLMAKLPGEEEEVPLPLKHTDVQGQISGYIATVEVTQQFHNPYSEKIEAVYVFPLPQNAAVNEFIMVIGERRIRGIIREREEAERIYEQARSQGYVASLLTQERPNIFTQKVANIEPENEIDINIKYFNTLAYVDGWYEFVFPMVVGPRFNPPAFSDGVGAVGRRKYSTSGQKTEVQYLKPGERSGHDISLS
jgi:Ca-activated chloride channel family protein